MTTPPVYISDEALMKLRELLEDHLDQSVRLKAYPTGEC